MFSNFKSLWGGKLCIRLAALFAALAMAFGIAMLSAHSMAIPVLMYHHITADENEPENSMIVTEARFRADLEFLRDEGYTALLPADLVRIRAGADKLPSKPVLITFDDGYESNYTLAFPLLKETGMKAVIAVVVSHIRQEGEASPYALERLDWAECREMYESGLVDIGSHTYKLHNDANGGNPNLNGCDGVQRLENESRAAYRARVGGDLHNSIAAIEHAVGNDCIYFSYPFGAADPWFDDLLAREGVFVTASTIQKTASLAFGTLDLPRYRITMSLPVSALLKGK